MKRFYFVLPVMCCVVVGSLGLRADLVRVTGDRVNLRAADHMNAEVVAQVNEDDQLEAVSFSEEWVEVRPPRHVDCWVHRDFVDRDRVLPRRLNVRSGPGVNYLSVGTLARDDQVTVRGEFGEWLQIAPPPTVSVWISREYVEQVLAAEDADEPEAAPDIEPDKPEQDEWLVTLDAVTPLPPARVPAPVDEQAPADVTRRPRPRLERTQPLPAHWRLIPLEGQGRRVEVSGQLRSAGVMRRRPTRYRLVRADGRQAELICYLHGNEEQLAGFEHEHLEVAGREYWIQGYQSPVVVVDRIRLSP